MNQPAKSPPPRSFIRGLGLFDCTMIVAGSMIGSGIFIVPADMARQLGSPGWLMLAWVITALLAIMAALSYGELAGMMPGVGGQYVYLRQAYSPLWGFLYGWTLFLVIQTGTIAAVAVAFAKFAGVIFPAISQTPGSKLFGVGPVSVYPTTLVAMGVLVLLTAVNSAGLKTGKTVQNIFTVTKIAGLLLLIGLGFAFGANSASIQANLKDLWSASFTQLSGDQAFSTSLSGLALFSVLGTAMVGSLFSADAWNNATFTAAEVKNARRDLPLGLLFGVGLVCLLYCLANLAYLAVLPLHGNPPGLTPLERGMQFALQDRVATAAAEVTLGPAGAVGMAVLIMISTFGCINGMVLAGARVYYAMAKDGLFFGAVGTLNRRGVPAHGLILQCLWACGLTLSGTYTQLLDYVIFAVLIFYVLTIAAVFVLRVRQPQAERPCRAFGYPWVPALYILIAGAIAIDLLLSAKTRSNTWPGLLLVLAGVPAYFLWRILGRAPRTPPGPAN